VQTYAHQTLKEEALFKMFEINNSLKVLNDVFSMCPTNMILKGVILVSDLNLCNFT